MEQASLQLEESFVTNLEFHTPDEPPDEDDARLEDRVVASVTLFGPFVRIKERTLWFIGLEIRFAAWVERLSYTGRIELQGFFRVPDVPGAADQAGRLVTVAGSSILYSAAREYLLLVTSRAPCGPIQLPTKSFAGPTPRAVEADRKDARARPAKRTAKAAPKSRRRAPKAAPKSPPSRPRPRRH